MEYTIHSGRLTASVSDAGAELIRLQLDNVDYLWEGDPTFWKEHAPVLFPYVGRFTDGKYTLHGKEYEMTIHGFAKKNVFTVKNCTEDSITLELTDSEATRAIYPYGFRFQVTYTAAGNRLLITFGVENSSDEIMYFGLGGHPGFKVPLEEGLSFEDYSLVFSGKCTPSHVEFSPAAFVAQSRPIYPLKDGTSIPLHHDLFDNDAVVLENMADTVSIRSEKGTRSVTVHFPGMPFVGFWHRPHTEAPYVAIEPWVTLPSRQDVVEEFSAKGDMIHLAPGASYTNNWDITLQ